MHLSKVFERGDHPSGKGWCDLVKWLEGTTSFSMKGEPTKLFVGKSWDFVQTTPPPPSPKVWTPKKIRKKKEVLIYEEEKSNVYLEF